MDKYLAYLKKNLEMTLGKKITIGSTTKIIGAKTEEEIKEVRKNGQAILDIDIEDGSTPMKLGDIEEGNILYETLDKFQEVLEPLGVDYSNLNDMWFVWRENMMEKRMERFEPEVKEALKPLIEETIKNFHEEEAE